MELRNDNFEEEVLEEEGPVFVDFWGSWCLACQQMKPLVKKLKEEIGGKVKVCYLNIDKNSKVADRFEVEETPTHILFLEGEPVEREVAAKTPEQLKEMIGKHVDLDGK
ncbi:MAG: thioredoxin family protein [Candidatus Aenigmatarchaeota archaeon]